MPKRPKIPAELAREVLIESGHRCAVCGVPCPLERAHIIPWHKSNEHRKENLICLCANCHQRADLEKWGVKTLKEYKRRPWVLRKYENFDRTPYPAAKIELILEMDINNFDEKEQRWLQYAIAGFLDIPPNNIKISMIKTNSVKVTIELPTKDAGELLKALKNNDPELKKYLSPIVIVGFRLEDGECEFKLEDKVTKLRVFVASTGDVSEERERLKNVLDELNRTEAKYKGLILQYIGWETDDWPNFGEDAPEVINKQIGSYDIFIGIMWKRFGTPTKLAGSGAVEEFNKAYNLWSKYGRPRIMLYFNSAPFFPSSVDETEELAKVLEFKKKAGGKGSLFWEYNGPEEFEKIARKHLSKGILAREIYENTISPPKVAKLPFEFYQVLFNELDMYITQFEQLQRDYERELKGKVLEFAVDFSEIHDYMYPHSPNSSRSSLNRYVFNKIENPLTLMPGAVGELLTDLERAIPSSEELEADPITIYEDVALFINNFPAVRNNEEKVIELYRQAEEQLKEIWGDLFNAVIKDARHTALYTVKSLIDKRKLSPIKGIQKITHFPTDIRKKVQWVKNRLNIERPGRFRSNQVDTIDFAVTLLLNTLEYGRKKRYISIYTQSRLFINACTASPLLRWEDDFLVRGANYFKFRTRLQELIPSTVKRHNFVVKWAEKCKKMQKEIPDLIELNKESSKKKTPSLALLNLYREFDEECRIPLSFTGDFSKIEKSDIKKRASLLYELLKEKGEFRGKTGEAFEVLKKYLQDLQNQFTLFSPEKVQAHDSKTYMENLAKWLEAEEIE